MASGENDRGWTKGGNEDGKKRIVGGIPRRESSGNSLIHERIRQLSIDVEDDLPKGVKTSVERDDSKNKVSFRKKRNSFNSVSVSLSQTGSTNIHTRTSPSENGNTQVSQASHMLTQRIAKVMVKEQNDGGVKNSYTSSRQKFGNIENHDNESVGQRAIESKDHTNDPKSLYQRNSSNLKSQSCSSIPKKLAVNKLVSPSTNIHGQYSSRIQTKTARSSSQFTAKSSYSASQKNTPPFRKHFPVLEKTINEITSVDNVSKQGPGTDIESSSLICEDLHAPTDFVCETNSVADEVQGHQSPLLHTQNALQNKGIYFTNTYKSSSVSSSKNSTVESLATETSKNITTSCTRTGVDNRASELTSYEQELSHQLHSSTEECFENDAPDTIAKINSFDGVTGTDNKPEQSPNELENKLEKVRIEIPLENSDSDSDSEVKNINNNSIVPIIRLSIDETHTEHFSTEKCLPKDQYNYEITHACSNDSSIETSLIASDGRDDDNIPTKNTALELTLNETLELGIKPMDIYASSQMSTEYPDTNMDYDCNTNEEVTDANISLQPPGQDNGYILLEAKSTSCSESCEVTLQNDLVNLLSEKTDERNKQKDEFKTELNQTEIERSILPNTMQHENNYHNKTGVNKATATIHAENHFTNQGESSKQKSGDAISCTTTVVKESTINLNEGSPSSKRYNDYSEGSEEIGKCHNIPISGRTPKPDSKYASFDQVTDRIQITSLDSYSTSSGSENEKEPLDLNVNNNKQVYSNNTDTSDTCDAKHEGKERTRRRKLTKRRSKNIDKNKNYFITGTSTKGKQNVTDTSDNDFIRSNTSDDSSCHELKVENKQSYDRETNSDNHNSESIIATSSLINTHTDNSTTAGTDQCMSLGPAPEKEVHEQSLSTVALATSRNVGSVSMSSIDALAREQVTRGSLPSVIKDTQNGDDHSKLDNWKFPAFDSRLKRVSTLKLKSFPKSPLFSPRTKSHSESGYTSDITSSVSDISKWEKHDTNKVPCKQITPEEEALKRLSTNPFSLITRFTHDTQKMQSQSSPNIPKDNTDFGDYIEKEEDISGDESIPSNTLTQKYNKEKPSFTSPSYETPTDVVIPPPDIFRDTKFVSRPPVNITNVKTIANGNSQPYLVEPFEIPTVVPPPPPSDEVHEEVTEITGIVRRKFTRPTLPLTMLKGPSEYNADVYVTNKEETGSDSDEVQLDLREVEKAGPFNKRSKRTTLVQTPHLEGIPEEKVKRSAIRGESIEEVQRKEIECESHKVDDKENGYYSLSSDPRSTPKDLSYEDLSSGMEYDPNFETEQTVTRSKSDSLLAGLTEDESHHSEVAINGHTTKNNSSKSDPNIANIIKEQDRGSSTSIESNDKPRAASVTSNEDSGLETPSTTPVIPVTPTEDHQCPTPRRKTPKSEMRKHVLNNLLDTEKSYVLNLNIMVKTYLEPLKKPDSINTIEPTQVDEIFYQIPDILNAHEIFLEQLQKKVNSWTDEQIIGDIFVDSFTNCFLMDSYSNFITHYAQANEAIRNATNARPQFQKYIEQCSKEHKEKLTLSDLLIMPVQRIPRYELILREFLKFTSIDHPDYENLQVALGEIKTLASRMNKGELDAHQAEKDVDRLRDIEATIEGITELVMGARKFIRQDLVAEVKTSTATVKKDRCLFLFSDLLVCTTVRKKTHALRRGSLGLFTGQSAAELNRYRFLWKLPLEDFEILKTHTPQSKIGGKEIESLEKDLKLLEGVSVSIKQLETDHLSLENIVKDMKYELSNKIKELQNAPAPTATLSPAQSRIDIQTQTEEGTVNYTFHFLSAECKSSWEAYFEDAKQKLAYSRDSLSPEFQYLMPITKTRSGMQFTCAAPSHISGLSCKNRTPNSSCDVWVCNSDGYVGQVCLLALVPEAESKASLSVCSAKIVCIAVVPGGRLVSTKQGNLENNSSKLNNTGDNISINKYKKNSKLSSSSSKHKKSFESEDDERVETIIAFDSSDDDENGIGIGSPFIGPSAFGGRMSPDGSSLGTVESVEGDPDSSEEDDYSSDDGERRGSSTTNASKGSISGGNSDYILNEYIDSDSDEQSTMWLGTQDGYLYIYHSNETISTQRKSKMKIYHGFPVTCILYFENKVFVAFNNGEICIYKHEPNNNGWQVSDPQKIQVSLTASSLICMTAVAGRVWCGCQHQIILVNATTFNIENTITVGTDSHRQIHKVVSSGLGVWISLQSSSVIKLYHATTYENLTEIDIAPAVHKMLSGADAIIRQHKAACLRVTSLLICKDLLWIGTSAGVILTNPLPSITASTSVLRCGSGPTGSPHGHTGHVRFLTSVEVPKSLFKPVDYDNQKDSSRVSPQTTSSKKSKENISKSNNSDCTNATVTLVVSGGDGYEDFRYNQQTETVGRDDSTNHLLIWRV